MQLVYFNDLHKNLGCNKGRTAKISIIPVTFTVLPVKFYALQLPSVPLFFCPLSPSADKRPVGTDISIAQKTCVFRPVDISVAALKRCKLIYQSVYSLLGGTPSVCSLRSQPPSPRGRLTLSVTPYGVPAPPKGELLGIAEKFLITSDTLVTWLTACALSVTCGDSSPKGRAKSTAESFLIIPNTLASSLRPWLPLRGKTSPAPGEDVTVGDKRGNLARERLRGFIPRKKAAAPGTAQRLVYNIKVSQFFFAA